MRILFIRSHLNLGWNECRGQWNSTCFGVGILSSRSEGSGRLGIVFSEMASNHALVKRRAGGRPEGGPPSNSWRQYYDTQATMTDSVLHCSPARILCAECLGSGRNHRFTCCRCTYLPPKVVQYGSGDRSRPSTDNLNESFLFKAMLVLKGTLWMRN